MGWADDWERNKTSFEKRAKLLWPDFIDGLPQTLPDPIELFVIGGLTRNGFSYHDIDFYVEADGPKVGIYKAALNAMTEELFNMPSHIGNHIYYTISPTPVPIKLYDAGELKDKTTLKALVTVLDPGIRNKVSAAVRLNDRIVVIEAALSITPPVYVEPPREWSPV